jgi:hypothetical protein
VLYRLAGSVAGPVGLAADAVGGGGGRAALQALSYFDLKK